MKKNEKSKLIATYRPVLCHILNHEKQSEKFLWGFSSPALNLRYNRGKVEETDKTSKIGRLCFLVLKR